MNLLFLILLWTRFTRGLALQCLGKNKPDTRHSPGPGQCNWQRRQLLWSTASPALLSLVLFPTASTAKSYSSNARNLERMNTGDMSGGSVYDNNPKSEAGKKRRAITGCRSVTAREEAATTILRVDNLSEKECNQMVLQGNPEFMLQALRNLDCPTCPYGIATSR